MTALITDTVNNRKTLLEALNKELEALQEASDKVLKRAEKYSNSFMDRARIKDKLAEVAGKLKQITSIDEGKALQAEHRELQEELEFTTIIQENQRGALADELEQLAIPFYQQEPRAFQALQALYTEIYRTTTPETVAQDLQATQELVSKKVGLGNTVKHTLIEHGVFDNRGSDKVVKTAKGTVILGHNATVDIRPLEGLKKAVERGGR